MSTEQVNNLVSELFIYITGEVSKEQLLNHITQELNMPQEVAEHVNYLFCDAIDINTGANMFPIKCYEEEGI